MDRFCFSLPLLHNLVTSITTMDPWTLLLQLFFKNAHWSNHRGHRICKNISSHSLPNYTSTCNLLFFLINTLFFLINPFLAFSLSFVFTEWYKARSAVTTQCPFSSLQRTTKGSPDVKERPQKLFGEDGEQELGEKWRRGSQCWAYTVSEAVCLQPSSTQVQGKGWKPTWKATPQPAPPGWYRCHRWARPGLPYFHQPWPSTKLSYLIQTGPKVKWLPAEDVFED